MARVLVFLSILATAACATSGATPRPFPGSSYPVPESVGPPITLPGESIAVTALGLRGVRYRNGGADPSGFDCSGFVKYVFEQHGLALPRSVAEQFQLGADVAPGTIQPGDLVFFSTVAPGASHVGIAVGSAEFVHAPSSNGVVRSERIDAGYWAARLVGARRVMK